MRFSKLFLLLLLVSLAAVAQNSFSIPSTIYAEGGLHAGTVVRQSVTDERGWFVSEYDTTNLTITGPAARDLSHVLDAKVSPATNGGVTAWRGENVTCLRDARGTKADDPAFTCELNIDQGGKASPGHVPEPRGGGSVRN